MLTDSRTNSDLFKCGLSRTPITKSSFLKIIINKCLIGSCCSTAIFFLITLPTFGQIENSTKQSESYLDIQWISGGHSREVKSVSFSPNGKFIASAGDDKTAKLWEYPSGKLIHTLIGHQKSVSATTFSPDSTILFSGGRDGTIKVWRVIDGTLLRTIIYRQVDDLENPSFTLFSDSNWVGLFEEGTFARRVAIWQWTDGVRIFNQDGVQAMSPTLNVILNIWGEVTKISDGRLQYKISDSLFYPVFSNDGSKLAAIKLSSPRQIFIINALTGATLQTMTPPKGDDFSIGNSGKIMSFSPDAKLLACRLGQTLATSPCDVFLMDTEFGVSLNVLKGHGATVNSVAFSPDGTRIITAGNDNVIKLWDTATGTLLGNINSSRGISTCVTLSPNENTVAAGFRSIYSDVAYQYEIDGANVYSASQGTLLGVLTPYKMDGVSSAVQAVRFSPDSTILATGYGACDGGLRMWDWATRQQVKYFPGDKCGFIKWSADSSTLFRSYQPLFSPDSGLLVTTAIDGKELHHNTDRNITCLEVSPDRSLIAMGRPDATLRIDTWNGKTTVLKKELVGHSDAITAVAFSADGKTLASASADKTVRLWNTSDWAIRRILVGHTNRVNCLAFSPSPNILASASEDNSMRIWNVDDGSLLGIYYAEMCNVKSIEFSKSGSVFAFSRDDGTVGVARNPFLSPMINNPILIVSKGEPGSGITLKLQGQKGQSYMIEKSNDLMFWKDMILIELTVSDGSSIQVTCDKSVEYYRARQK